MANQQKDFRTAYRRVEGLGAAHHGVGHWWAQRLTALALVPLSLWFMYALVSAMLSSNVLKVSEWFASPINAIIMALLLGATFWHMRLGMQVVVEDYVKTPVNKYALLILNNFFCVVLGVVSIVAVLKLHLLDAAAGSL